MGDERTIRWGILGCGRIADTFAQALKAVAGAALTAVGSRSREKAEAFGAKHGVASCHGSYADLVADERIDIVYVATPHVSHRADTLACLKNGKAVLCEKPFAVNASEARDMVAAAKRNRRFLMEAMWTRFLPAMAEVRRLLAEGAIGEPRMLTADFGFRCQWNPEGRLLNPALGGGGLLDVGVYTVSLASMVFGPALRVAALAHVGATGVDEQAGMVLEHGDGRLSVLACGVRTRTAHGARIMGTEGNIQIPEFWRAKRLIVESEKAGRKELEMPFSGNGYTHEAEEAQNCLRRGALESEVMPWAETLAVMRTLDRIRAGWGLRYPCERKASRRSRAASGTGGSAVREGRRRRDSK